MTFDLDQPMFYDLCLGDVGLAQSVATSHHPERMGLASPLTCAHSPRFRLTSMASSGELPAFKIRGQWRVRRADFERWMTDKASNRAKSDEDEV